MPRYLLKTLGCKANFYDSQLIEDALQKEGWSPSGESSEAQLCVINSCTVTDEADKQTRKMASRLARENPNAVIVVTGCAAEVNPQDLSKSPGVHYVVGNQNKNQLVDLVLNEVQSHSPITSHILKHQKILGKTKNYEVLPSHHPHDREWPAATDSFVTPPTNLHGHTSKTRSFLKIQEGCNSFCTYCIIPYGRGPSRSLRPREVLEQVRTLVREGIHEVIITGTNIGDYGTDWGPNPALGDLLEMILTQTDLKRLRVSSLDPTEITPQIINLMKNHPRFCPHFHVSLQSPHSRILKLMKRRYGFEEVKHCLEVISQISQLNGGVFVGMDIITGFPGETDEEFEWTYETLKSLPWNRLHVFPYSERKGTPATRLPRSVPQSVRIQRTRKLTQLSLDRLVQFHRALLGEMRVLDQVLVERKGEGEWTAGYTPNYIRVLLPKDSPVSQNQLISVKPIDLMIDSRNSDVALVSKFVV